MKISKIDSIEKESSRTKESFSYYGRCGSKQDIDSNHPQWLAKKLWKYNTNPIPFECCYDSQLYNFKFINQKLIVENTKFCGCETKKHSQLHLNKEHQSIARVFITKGRHNSHRIFCGS